MKGILFVVSGPSGVGKGTVLDKLMNDFNEINYSVSATTRQPRMGEVDGRDYFFLSEEKFLERKANNEFLETARVHNNLYGTPRNYVEQCINKGEDIILELDIQGARQIRNYFPEAVMIFLVPPSLEELQNRLEKRGTEDSESKKIRLRNAKEELKEMEDYDYDIVNDELENTIEQIKEIIKKERLKKGG